MSCVYFLTSDVIETQRHCSFIFRNLCHRCNFLLKNNLRACIKPGVEYFLFAWKSVLKRQFPGGMALFKVLYSAGYFFFFFAGCTFQGFEQSIPTTTYIFSNQSTKWWRTLSRHGGLNTMVQGECKSHLHPHGVSGLEFLSFILWRVPEYDGIEWNTSRFDMGKERKGLGYHNRVCHTLHFNGFISSCIVSALLITCRTFLWDHFFPIKGYHDVMENQETWIWGA